MLETSKGNVWDRGNIVSTDTLIITAMPVPWQRLTEEGDNLYRSVSDLIMYSTGGRAACSTADLYLILMNIKTTHSTLLGRYLKQGIL
jgi:hypothetical protein